MSVEGKVILVTGSTDGIGMQTALELAGMGAHVIVHGRSPERSEKTVREIRSTTGSDQIDWLAADLSSQQQVRQLAHAIRTRYDHLDVLINNAGVYLKQRRLTVDGLETTFAVNHLAPFMLTNLLRDLLEASAPSRVITVSSTTHQSIREVDFDNLQGEKWYDGYHAYALSKLGNILFTYELARRLENTGVTANALHPGAVNTKLLRAGFGNYGHDLERGAETPVYLASSPDVQDFTGKYFVDKRPVPSSTLSYDQELQEQFWNIGEQLTDLARKESRMNQPLSEPHQQGNLLRQVHEGMRVYDRDGKDIGTVDRVYISEVSPEAERRGLGPATEENRNPNPDQPRGAVLEDIARVFEPDRLPDTLQRRLYKNGFVRVNASGLLAADRYVLPDQVSRVSDGKVTLNVSRQELIKH